MDIGVVMLVKNEALRVEGALAPILDQLAQVVVLDTGSTDGTQDLLRERLRIEPVPAQLDHHPLGGYGRLRNRGLAMLDTPWRLTLDADERLEPGGFRDLRSQQPPPNVGGIFLRWHNLMEDADAFDDYKCALFRRGVHQTGLIHENVQPSLRQRGLVGRCSDSVVLEHHPESRKDAWKRETYRRLLLMAMQSEPRIPRYPWFAGYAAIRDGELDQAATWLSRAANSQHPHYPVERINARIALTTVSAGRGDSGLTSRHHREALRLFQELDDDFEVQVNTWYRPWLELAADLIAEHRLDEIRLPRFAC